MKKLRILHTLLGSLVLVFMAVTAFAAVTTNYEYDDLYRLTRAARSDGTIIDYSYDDSGNRTRKEVSKPFINGACGAANGGTFTSTPIYDLCSTGITSIVTGNGPWFWSCQGLNGGLSAGCRANFDAPIRVITQLTSNAADDVNPSWSPDGNTIAFVSNRIDSTDGSDLFAIQPDGQNERLLAQFTVTDPWHGRFGQPSWIGQSGDLLVMDFKYFHEVMRFNLSQAIAANALPVNRSVWDGDSSYLTRLLFVPGGQGGGTPVTSPDGSKLAWRHTGGTTYMLRVYSSNMNAFLGDTDTAGTLLLQISGGGWLDDPISFSPDGTKLVFAGCISNCQGKGSDLHIIDVATKAVTKLTTSGEQGAGNNYPAWSSQNKIVFSSRPNASANYDLYTINPDGTGQTRLTQNSWNSINSTWSPDGNSIAYASNQNGNYDIYKMTGVNNQNVSLTVQVNNTSNAMGTGGGTVTSDPVGISCTTGSCSTPFALGTPVTLIPSPNIYSVFSGWTGACTNGAENCPLNMDSDKNVNANFTAAPKAKNITTNTPYSMLSAALSSANNDNEIWSLDIQFDGSVTISKSITLKGGWNTSYAAKSGLSTELNGDLTIQNGNSRIETIDVKGVMTIQGGTLILNGMTLK
jgi:YD repeat-containing protein